MNWKEKITEVSQNNWGGLPYKDLKRELVRNYQLIDFFMSKTVDEYLNRSEASVLKSIRTDNPPELFVEELLSAEKAGKKRVKVIKALEE